MRHDITTEQAFELFPNQVAAIQKEAAKKLKRSKNKKKGNSIDELTWHIDYCEEIVNSGLLERLFTPTPVQKPTSSEEVADIVSRTSACLTGEMVGAYGNATLDIIPSLLVSHIRARVEKDRADTKAENERQALLSPEEKQKELNELLGQLRGTGFFEIKL